MSALHHLFYLVLPLALGLGLEACEAVAAAEVVVVVVVVVRAAVNCSYPASSACRLRTSGDASYGNRPCATHEQIKKK